MEKISSLSGFFLFIRVLSILAIAFYVYWVPDNILTVEKSALYLLLFVYLVFNSFTMRLLSITKTQINRLLYLILTGDIIFITLLVRFTGGFKSNFFLAYLLLGAMEASFFGFRLGLIVGGFSTLSYIFGNIDLLGDIYWMHLVLRVFFIIVIAGIVGFYSEKGRENEEVARLNTVLDKKVKELLMLYDIGKSIHSDLDLNKLLNDILDALGTALGLKSTAIFILNEADGRLKVMATKGFPEELDDLSYDIGEGVVGLVAKEEMPILIQDVSADERFLYFKGRKRDVSSFVAVPIESMGAVIGVLCATDPSSNVFSDEDKRLLAIVADQISTAVVNAKLYEETQKLARTDGLTGLYTARVLYDALQSETDRARRYGDSFSLLMLDLDYFKAHNDEFGHPSGDEVLKSVAFIISRNCRQSDVVARYGGEEFAALLVNVDKIEAVRIAERIRRDVEFQEFKGNDQEPRVHKTVSIGIAEFPNDATDKLDLVKKADEALYRAKKNGRNRVCV